MKALALTSETVTTAYVCTECTGAFLEQKAAGFILSSRFDASDSSIIPSPFVLSCPSCGKSMNLISHNGSEFYSCKTCDAIFIEQPGLPLLFRQTLENANGFIPAGPVNPMELHCCDCGVLLPSPTDCVTAPAGACCKRCERLALGHSGHKVQNLHMSTYKNMEIKIDHRNQNVRSRISVTPNEPCILDFTIHSLSLPEKMLRLGHRKFRNCGLVSSYYDVREKIGDRDPLYLFLAQRGVASIFIQLAEIGKCEICFKPHNICFDLTAPFVSSELRLRFEATVRRLLNAYTVFEKYLEETVSVDDDFVLPDN